MLLKKYLWSKYFRNLPNRIMIKYTSVVCCFLMFICTASGQLLNGDFRFADGLYHTHEALLKNQPDLESDTSRYEIISSGSTGNLFAALKGDELISLDHFDSILYIVENGRVYINADEDLRGLHRFVLLSVQGKIGLFERDYEEKVVVPIKAYNPLNGQPFRSGEIEKKVRTTVPYLLVFETGKFMPFTYRNFLGLISDDKELVNQVLEIDTEDRNEKLYKCLLIYNDRNSFDLENNND